MSISIDKELDLLGNPKGVRVAATYSDWDYCTLLSRRGYKKERLDSGQWFWYLETTDVDNEIDFLLKRIEKFTNIQTPK